jgi:hypothetical protein
MRWCMPHETEGTRPFQTRLFEQCAAAGVEQARPPAALWHPRLTLRDVSTIRTKLWQKHVSRPHNCVRGVLSG